MAYDPSLGKTSEDFRFIFTDREAIGKNKQKILSHLGPVPQVSGRLCEAKPEAKLPWRCTHVKNRLQIGIYFLKFLKISDFLRNF